MFIEIDDVRYNVVLHKDMRRSFSFVEGKNFGEAISHSVIFDTIGTEFSYELEIDPHPTNAGPYDDLYRVITSPDRKHKITLPHGADPSGTITFYGYIEGGSDYLYGEVTDVMGTEKNRWHGLSFRIKPIKPQRLAEEEFAIIDFHANSETAETGSSLTWSWKFVRFGGEITYYVYFYKDGTRIGPPIMPQIAPAWSGQTQIDASATLPASYVTAGGDYTCRVRATSQNRDNSAEVSGSPVAVSGAAVITITSQPQNRVGTLNANALFTVIALGESLSYQWQYSADKGRTWANSPAEGNQTDSLTVPVTLDRNGYLYRCIISSGESQIISNAAELQVFAIITEPQSAVAVLDTPVEFTVAATGTNLTYQWQYSSNEGSTWADSPATGNKTNTLSLTATTYRDGYYYRCIVKSGLLTLTSDEARLDVCAIVTQPPEVVVAPIGYTVSIGLTATGPDLSYQWQYSPDKGVSWYDSPADGNKTDTLTVVATSERNGLYYKCIVSSGYGRAVMPSEITELQVSED